MKYFGKLRLNPMVSKQGQKCPGMEDHSYISTTGDELKLPWIEYHNWHLSGDN